MEPDLIHGLVLLRVMRDAGLRLWIDGDKLMVDGAMTEGQRAFIRRCKGLLKSALAVETFEPKTIWLHRPDGVVRDLSGKDRVPR